MAELNLRLKGNAAGKFYVDETCVDCDVCRQGAPDMFVRDDEIGFSIVHHQPRDPSEELLAYEALESCPTQSIGSDGDQVLKS